MARMHLLSRTPLALAVALGAMSCDVHDNVINIPNAKVNADVSADVDVDNVKPGQNIPVTVNVENVYLVAPEATPPADHVADAGHIQVYLDDVASPALLKTADKMFNFPIPAGTKAGKHKMICRVHRHDGTATGTKVEVNVTVTVNGANGDAGVTVDIDANVSSSGGATGSGGAGTGGSSGSGGQAGSPASASGGAGGA